MHLATLASQGRPQGIPPMDLPGDPSGVPGDCF